MRRHRPRSCFTPQYVGLLILFLLCLRPPPTYTVDSNKRKTCCGPRNDNRTPLYVGGLFAMSGKRPSSAKGLSELHFTKTAIKLINDRDIIPNHRLVLIYNDTLCDPGIGLDRFFHIFLNYKVWLFIGPVCSAVAESIAEVARISGMILISYGATSPALSSRSKYPTFHRLVPSDSSHNVARAHFLHRFNWTSVAILYQEEQLFSLAASDMARVFSAVRPQIKVTSLLSFVDDTADVQAKITKLKHSGARIIIGSFQENTARKVMCQAYRNGLYGKRYVWILLGWYTDHWWNKTAFNDCTSEQMQSAVEGHFSVSSFTQLHPGQKGSSSLTTDDILRLAEPRPTPVKSIYAPIAFDTAWAVAYLLKRALYSNITVDDIVNHNPWMGNNVSFVNPLLRMLNELKFDGITGHIELNLGDRVASSMFRQNQCDGHLCSMNRVALFNTTKHVLDMKCRGCVEIEWPGDGPPLDREIIEFVDRLIDPIAAAVIATLCSIGIAVALVFLVLNYAYGKHKVIKLSSPRLNNVLAFGCICIYLGVVLLGMNNNLKPSYLFPNFCALRICSLMMGFSLAFGAMFMKTYRVHQIFTRGAASVIKNKLLKDRHLISGIFSLLILDAALVIAWNIFHPFRIRIFYHTVETNPDETHVVPRSYHCESDHLPEWQAAVYSYKGLLVSFGVFMAWETRNVRIPMLNDSHYIVLSTYNVVLSSIVGVAMSNILTNKPTLSYCVVAACIIMSCTAVLCLLFLPKVYAIFFYSPSRDETRLIHKSSMSNKSDLKQEGSTVRFDVVDRNELQLRASIQNSYFKSQLDELENKIVRMRSLLSEPLVPYPRIDEEVLKLLPESLIDHQRHLKKY